MNRVRAGVSATPSLCRTRMPDAGEKSATGMARTSIMYLRGDGIHRDKQQERVDVSPSAGVIRRHLVRSVCLPMSRDRAGGRARRQRGGEQSETPKAKHSNMISPRPFVLREGTSSSKTLRVHDSGFHDGESQGRERGAGS